jgi:hypothetical protein
MTTANPTPRAALGRAGWRIDADEPHVVEASGGERYGVAVFFQGGRFPSSTVTAAKIFSTTRLGKRPPASSRPLR